MSSAERIGEPFHDKESQQFVARYIERAPLSLEKLSIQDDIISYTISDNTTHEFDALEFMATLSAHIPRPYESLTRYLGRYSCRRRGERAKQTALATTDTTETDTTASERQDADPLPHRPKSSWAACIKRIYEINPLECPICKAQMRIVAFLQDPNAISAIMKAHLSTSSGEQGFQTSGHRRRSLGTSIPKKLSMSSLTTTPSTESGTHQNTPNLPLPLTTATGRSGLAPHFHPISADLPLVEPLETTVSAPLPVSDGRHRADTTWQLALQNSINPTTKNLATTNQLVINTLYQYSQKCD